MNPRDDRPRDDEPDPLDDVDFDDLDHPPGTPGSHWWPELLAHIDDWWMHDRPTLPALRQAATIAPRRITGGVVAGAGVLLATVIALLWWLIAAIVGAISGIAEAIADSGRQATTDGAHAVAGDNLTRTITDPVHAYLTQHATGLPATAGQLWLTWLAATGLLFALAALGSRGARIGWTLTGATTAAMVYAATAPTGRPVAAGLTVTVWAVLSVIAFNRLTTGERPTLHISLPTWRRPRDDDE